jgi:hypothetical protein
VESVPRFIQYVGIDYSGAETPTSSLKGLRVYVATPASQAVEFLPPLSPRKYWTRRGLAEWLAGLLTESGPTLVGIDHGFSFPICYFETHGILPDWRVFLEDFQKHWPTDADDNYVDFIRDGRAGMGHKRQGNTRWRRLTELRAGAAKSVFHFDVQGSVAKSTHSGIPWLRYLGNSLAGKIHFWPFDGWELPEGKSVLVEVYPSLWSKAFASEGRTPDQHDAYSVAEWLRRADRDGSLTGFTQPSLLPGEKAVAQVEGWILGVM